MIANEACCGNQHELLFFARYMMARRITHDPMREMNYYNDPSLLTRRFAKCRHMLTRNRPDAQYERYDIVPK